ncbi:MAG: VWA domain-containing protein, partial [Verrucomicrobiota bacterium]
MTGLTFAQPFWLWGILVLILPILLRVRSHFYAAKQLPGLVSPKLLPQLVSGGSGKRRWVTFSLQCLALSAAFIALARPQAGFVEIETQSESRNLLIAVDTSRSMLAEDLKPNRLSRAKLAAVEILNSLPDDRVGIIAFAGKPFVQAPLTVDHEAVLESLRQLDTEVIPRGGTNLASAAELALETFEEAKVEQGAVVLFSDGEALEGTEKIESVRARAKRNNIVLLTIGVGTRDGSIIPELDENGRPLEGVFIKDESGQIVRSRLNPIA